jgi:uncharacterized protein (TIGR03435 family)
MTTDDMALVREYAANRSEAAFAALVERHIGLVHSAALRQVRDSQLAEEVGQVVFVVLARKAASLGPKTVLSAWLYRTTRYVAADMLRARRRRQLREQEAYMQSTLTEPDSDAWTQLAPLLDDAMAELGETDRAALVLRFFESKNARQIAETLRLNEVAAQKRVARALEKLRVRFLKRGVTLSVAVIGEAVAANAVQAAPVGLKVTVVGMAAKGAVVGSSILTTVDAVCKTMTFIKVKVAALIGVGVLAAGGASLWAVKSNLDLDEVAPQLTLRPTRFPGQFGGLDAGNRAFAKNAPISRLLSIAYETRQERIILPPNLPKQQYDLMLTLEKEPKEALKAEIKKRFGLVGHRQTIVTNILLLKVATTDAPGRTPAPSYRMGSDPIPASELAKPAPWWFWAEWPNTDFAHLAIDLEFQLKEMVRDDTGVKDHFKLTLRFPRPDVRDKSPPALKRAIREQLGLDLVPSREPVEFLVVERTR